MKNDKAGMIKIVLDYAFGDQLTVMGFDEPGQFPDEQRMGFLRPSGQGMFKRYVVAWFPSGDFKLWSIGPRGAAHPVHVPSSHWFRIGKYLQANFVSTQSILKIKNV